MCGVCGKVMPIQYGEDDFPFIKEALRFFIEKNKGADYHYQVLFNRFETEPCILCAGVGYEPDDFKRKKGKLICGRCCKEEGIQ